MIKKNYSNILFVDYTRSGFNPVDNNQADFTYNLIRQTIRYIEDELTTSRLLLDGAIPDYELVALDLSSKIKKLESQLNAVRGNLKAVKSWYKKKRHNIPGSKEDLKQKELLKAYISEIRKQHQKKAPIWDQNLPELEFLKMNRVRHRGEIYTFLPSQVRALRVMHEFYLERRKVVHQLDILKKLHPFNASHHPKYLRILFAGSKYKATKGVHPAWGKLIIQVSGMRNYYGLNLMQ